jgi:hypothetical protein
MLFDSRRRQRIRPLQKIRVDVYIIGKSSALRIRCDVCKPVFEICPIAYSVFVETWLPDFSSKLLTHTMRKPSFDALRATLNGLLCGGCQQHVNVLRHDYESMQQIASLIAVMKKSFEQQVGIYDSHKKSPTLIRHRCNGVGWHEQWKLRTAYLRA